ncbi:unnamed protein product [Rhizoctonia solani]|uniref:Amidase domain-containing protein n=1 Tax=Rhizoctonia solani TaxID=456999 RepID=A0A8H3GBY0_9AGAM|nr:unnamed protein product [Rhizoctonia solani]
MMQPLAIMYRFKGTLCLSFFFLFLSLLPPATFSFVARAPSIKYPDLYEASIKELQDGLDKGDFTSVDLVKAYFARIDEVNLKGPKLRAVIELNPQAIAQAAALDTERKRTGKRSPLHGIPLLVKDNIATLASEGMNTTAGSYALLKSVVPGDATVAAKLRKAGAILLGKSNMSEWANIRGIFISGWSAVGGQGTNPHYPSADPCGSSSGSGAATAIGLAAGSLGTETDGSIVCPSSYNNLVGIKPTVGLTSRTGVVPISPHQDTVGPMARSVADAAVILSIIAGRDNKDNYTQTAPSKVPDYTQFLDVNAIKGKRFGVPRAVFTNDSVTGNHPSINTAFNKSLDIIRSLGGIVVDPADLPSAYEIPDTPGWAVLNVDLKVELNKYLKSLKSIPTKADTLGKIIKFNEVYKDLEQPKGYEGQAVFIDAEATSGYNSTYYNALRENYELGRQRGIDDALRSYNLDALLLPSNGYTTTPSAKAGYPIVTGKILCPKFRLSSGAITQNQSHWDFIQMIRVSRVLGHIQSFQHRITATYSKPPKYPDLYEASILELQSGLDRCQFSSVDLVKAYLARIEEVNLKGPKLRAVIETNPNAVLQAASLDAERKRGKKRSPLHGIPILIKDNIASKGMNNTAGSHALFGSIVPGDATVTDKLRKAGAIILGKANLSEWMHFRDLYLAQGWSARGGQGTNPYYPGADPCGSSSGSAVATAIGLATASLGTETVGSLICPSSYNNVVGIKPTVGLTSRTGVIPVSSRQDTIGPISRSVADAAALLTAIAGRDNKDNFTQTAPKKIPDYTQFLNPAAIKGKRFGVPRDIFTNDAVTGNNPVINAEFDKALDTIRSMGGIIIDPIDSSLPSSFDSLQNNMASVLAVDFKVELNKYLKTLKSIPTRATSLAKLIAYNDAHQELEQPTGYEGQNIFLVSNMTSGYDSAYYDALRTNLALTREQGIDALLKSYKLDAIVVPSNGPMIIPAAIAGYPLITVPLGFHPDNTTVVPSSAGPNTVFPAPGVPFGLSFIGTAYSEPSLIGFAYAYEQRTHTRLKRRAYTEAIPTTQLKDVIR